MNRVHLQSNRSRESYVASRFDQLQARFKREISASDFRLEAIKRVLTPRAGLSVLDLGCGKGRFAKRLEELGVAVIGLDVSREMIGVAAKGGVCCVLGSARRLPFADASFDAVLAVEVLEHLESPHAMLDEARRVLIPGGTIIVIDKNAGSLSAARPWLPNLALKWLDETRGNWMYPRSAPARERWFWPSALKRLISVRFESVQVEFLLRPDESQRRLFRAVPFTRLLTLWTAKVPGGGVA